MTDAAAPVLFVAPQRTSRSSFRVRRADWRARCSLRNPQSLSLVLRDAGFSDRSGRLFALAGAAHVSRPLCCDLPRSARCPCVIGIDPTTPPGEYRVELDVMGQVRPAVLNVAKASRCASNPSASW